MSPAQNVVNQLRASASAPLAAQLVIGDGPETIRDLLIAAAECIEEALAQKPVDTQPEG